MDFIDDQPVTASTPALKKEDTNMSETKNYFESGSQGGSGWGPALGAFAGAVVGENGLFGGNNKGNAVTPDQLGTAINGLQGNIQRDGLEHSIHGVSRDIGLAAGGLALGITGVKDAVTAGAAQNALSLCGLGNAVTQGNAAIISTIQSGFASSERLALQQALDAERSRATELRIQLSEVHNNAQHATTQVLLNQVINAK